MTRDVLDDLIEFKLPALAQARANVSSPSIALFSRGGFRRGLVDEAAKRDSNELVDLNQLVSDLQP